MHLDSETLERVLHDELDPALEAAVRRHLQDCRECAARVTEARAREAGIFALLAELDHDPRGAPLRWEAQGAEARTGSAWRRVAVAAMVVVAAGGALYAIPGSPLRQWIADVREGSPAASTEIAGPESLSEAVSGLAVRPAGQYEIAFVARQEAGRIRVTLSASPEVEIRVAGPPVGLESAPERLVVANAGSRSSYEIRLPEAGPAIEIVVAGRPVLRRVGSRVETAAPRDGAGRYLVELAASPP